jgi:hypothetical protein
MRNGSEITVDEASKSFQNESGIYGEATFIEGNETFVREASVPRSGGIELLAQGSQHGADQVEHHANQPYLENLSQISNSASEFVKSTLIGSSKIVNGLFCRAGELVKHAPNRFIMSIIFTIAAFLLLQSPVVLENSAARYLGQFIPKSIAHPLNYFAEKDIFDLQSRMSNVEYELAQLKKNNNMNQASIKRLEELVPDFVVCRKDKTGVIQIPHDFWLALKDKIQGDPPLLRSPAAESDDRRHTSGQGLTVKGVQEIAISIWSNFIRQNDVQFKTLYSDAFNDMWARRLKDALNDNVVVSKTEFIEAVQKNWDESQALIKAQVGQLAADVEQSIQTAKQQSAGLTESEVKVVSETVFRQLVPRAQLEALATAKIHENVEYSLLRFNHFSLGGGAVINPTLISPTYQSPKRPNYLTRLLLGIQSPNPAAKALTKWDEAGDCWCAPSKGKHPGIQLGVLITNDIYPDEVVIEHVPKTATLEPGSTPKQMELFAKIRENALDAVDELSSRLFPDAPVEIDLDDTWVRLAFWEYDLDGSRAQVFPVAINLKALNVSVKQFVVRARSNWGEEGRGAGADHTCLYRIRLHGEIAS